MFSIAKFLRSLPGKDLIIKMPGALSFAMNLERRQLNGKQPKEIFDTIYKNNSWANKKSVSGAGSDMASTEAVRKALPQLLSHFSISSILDVPCGDFSWMNNISLADIDYTGGDIVSELIERNRQFQSDHIEFLELNLISDNLPKADLILVRDCLVHFSYKHIRQSLNQIKASSSTYFLTTTFVDRTNNIDIHTGQWRPLNLQIAPFNFPNPLLLINEECTQWNGQYPDKSLGLWKISDLLTS
jgi:hypothetical protein